MLLFQFGKPGWKFNKKRVKVLTAEEIPDKAKSVVYWMSRDQRVQGTYTCLLFYICFSSFSENKFSFVVSVMNV